MVIARGAGQVGRPTTGVGITAPAKSLLWADEFDGPAGSAPNPANWSLFTGRKDVTTGELQYYQALPHNVDLDGSSSLRIRTYKEATPDGQTPPSATAFTSAWIYTQNKVDVVPPCKVVARMKVPYTFGLWPAFWLNSDPARVPAAYKSLGYTGWPGTGELDVAEWNLHPSHFEGHVIMGQNGSLATKVGPRANWTSHIDALSNAYHVYGIDWYTDHIDWHFDGAVIGTVRQLDAAAQNGDWTALQGKWPYYIILNTAIGSSAWAEVGNPTLASVFPQTMLVDWVRVYSI